MRRARSWTRQGERQAPAEARRHARRLRDGAARDRLVSRRAVVVGGSGGIGTAVVARLAADGWEVSSLSRREGTDVSDEAQGVEAFGRIEVLEAAVYCSP